MIELTNQDSEVQVDNPHRSDKVDCLLAQEHGNGLNKSAMNTKIKLAVTNQTLKARR